MECIITFDFNTKPKIAILNRNNFDTLRHERKIDKTRINMKVLRISSSCAWFAFSSSEGRKVKRSRREPLFSASVAPDNEISKKAAIVNERFMVLAIGLVEEIAAAFQLDGEGLCDIANSAFDF